MVASYFRGGQTTFPTSAGGPTPDDNRIREVDAWAMALEPRDTPLLSAIGLGPAVEQKPFYWGQSKRVAVATHLAAGISNSDATLQVSSGDGKIFQQWQVWEITDYITGTSFLDETTSEKVWVNVTPEASSADHIDLVRGYANTTAASHSDGALMELIGTAEPEMQEHAIGPVARGFQFSNYVQRFSEGVEADIAVQNMPTYENKSNVLLSDFEEATKTQKYLLEMAIWRGTKYAGSVSPERAPTLGGIEEYITTNVINVGGAQLKPSVLEAELRDLAKTVEQSRAKTLLMSYDTAAIFDTLIEPIRRATLDDTKYTLLLEKIQFRWGTYDVGVQRNCRNGRIYLVDLGLMKVRPFKGATWHISKKDGKVHGVDHDVRYISGDFTFQLEQEAAMGIIKNFNQDLDQYAVA